MLVHRTRPLAARLAHSPASIPLSATLALRTFSSGASLNEERAPALADITVDGVDRFNARQQDFRTQLADAQKRKDQLEKEARAREVGENGSKKGRLSTLLHGTPEGRDYDKQIEQSFSQVLARGKYVHSIVFHEVKPGKVDEYVKLVGSWYPRVATNPQFKVNLVGSWRTEVGDCDTFVHIWEYQRYQGYHASLHAIQRDPGFGPFDAQLKNLITTKSTSLMQEFSFWPTTPPRNLGGLFELRSYTLHPGNLLEWETHWRRGLKARREVMEGVGAWFVQIGDLNTVHHLWQFADLEERKVRREQSWSIEGWGETVHKTVPLIQTMRSRILIPMPWSPVA
ncbi:NIPSNAP-domain-containing protein [Eremomyces bilateralis CBS 781.70]|uniref:NIPSNAP-domain-containing protein n=1 Tax=Eremomyces bilateralis CBS 781.70 TaxID=1392243 RepID=A0A6G1G8W8_9PEZI|nr:NIPSNAP-domain-containing protein [Eremomyces bilateralis CBS 781.70]KAF1814517.1 NIPSNAP-domain-containing protein [Eremomyces bilateralis CBS 781.70]